MSKRDRLPSRREFLKIGATGLAAGALLPSCTRRPDETFVSDRPLSTRRTLGRTGLELPVVSMGSIYAVELIRTALDQGVAYIHTSPDYSERNHERLLGEVFKEAIRRNAPALIICHNHPSCAPRSM